MGLGACRIFRKAPHRSPDLHTHVLIRLPLFLPATRIGDRRQRRPQQLIAPFLGRQLGGTHPSLRPHTRVSHRIFRSNTSVATTSKHHKYKSIARSVATVASVAACFAVAVPGPPIAAPAPALESPVGLRSNHTSTCNRRMGLGACPTSLTPAVFSTLDDSPATPVL